MAAWLDRMGWLARPMVARFFALSLATALPRAASGEDVSTAPLNEQQAVRRALERAPLGRALAAEAAIERGRGAAAGAHPNPELAYMREQTFGALGSRENYLSLAQSIDLGGRRGLRVEAAEASARAVLSEGQAERLAIAAEARARFYEVLYRQQRLGALGGWRSRIDEALGVVSRREASGDAARYERRRLEREHAVALARLELEGAALARARARLAALLGERRTPFAAVVGTLLPEGEPDDTAALQAALQARPDVAAVEERLDALAQERSAASRWWLPDLRLEAGWKGVELGSQGRTDGFLLGATLALPLWDRGSAQRQVTEAEAEAARSRRDLLLAELHAEVVGVREEAVGLRRAAADFAEQAAAGSGELVRIAVAGHEGGELGVLELLDAYRGAADDALVALDMALAARRARIELDRMTGARWP